MEPLKSFEKQEAAFARLLKIMDELRENCPWDKKQTLESLRPLTIEEVYELGDAILQKDITGIKKELGDLMLHLVFYARIASETKEFDIADVLHTQCEKMIERHPHIYGDVKVKDEEEVKMNWEKIKLKSGNTSVLSGVPTGMPSLVKAQRIQEKAKGAGFDWNHKSEVWDKLQEELSELQEEVIAQKSASRIEEEFGDVFFAFINYARFLGVNAENALEKTNLKFQRRFQYMEQKIKEAGKNLAESTLPEMDQFWDEAKKNGL